MAKFKKFVFMSDTHGDKVHDAALSECLEFCKDWKPDLKVHGGDFLDLVSLRRGASIDEIMEHVGPDIDAGMECLERFEPNVLTLGNHDQRLWEACSSTNGFVASAAKEYVRSFDSKCESMKIKVKPYTVASNIYHYHGLAFHHGSKSSASPARSHGLIYGNSICGHVHRFDSASLQMFPAANSFTSGCMCKFEQMTYMQRHAAFLAQERGWIFGVVSPRTGSWHGWMAKELDGQIVLPNTNT